MGSIGPEETGSYYPPDKSLDLWQVTPDWEIKHKKGIKKSESHGCRRPSILSDPTTLFQDEKTEAQNTGGKFYYSLKSEN